MSRLDSSSRLTRRDALRNSALAGVAVWTGGRIGRGAENSPNEKLDIAFVGVGGRGGANLHGCLSQHVVALVDVDERRAAGAFGNFSSVPQFKDYRKMLDKVGNQIDAVVVSTPDHTHAVAAVAAMKLGKHCYCEKPLAHDVWEVRTMTETAKKQNVVTQMGTQIHAGSNYRRAVELVQSGAIGMVDEVHVWLGANFAGPAVPNIGQIPDVPESDKPVPETLGYDLWLGPVPNVPYNPAWVPYRWRFFWPFGNGQLGDFFCHYGDLAFWALGLTAPTTVESTGPVHELRASPWTISRHEYPARTIDGKQLPPVKLTWYNGGPYPELVKEKGIPQWKNAVLFIGSDGMLIADYGKHQLLPEEKFADFKRPEPFIPNSIGHHREWIEACKRGGDPLPTCHFGYGGPLTEADLLCNVALRVGKKITWDAENLKAVGCPEADQYIRRPRRPGWEL